MGKRNQLYKQDINHLEEVLKEIQKSGQEFVFMCDRADKGPALSVPEAVEVYRVNEQYLLVTLWSNKEKRGVADEYAFGSAPVGEAVDMEKIHVFNIQIWPLDESKRGTLAYPLVAALEPSN